MSPVPLLDLTRQWQQIRGEVLPELEKLFDSQRFVLGKWGNTLEEKMGDRICGLEAVGCASGSDALLLALMALGCEPGDGVITSSFTFFATGGAPVRLGARLFFTDIAEGDFNMSPVALHSFLQEQTEMRDGRCYHKASGTPMKFLIPVHIFGQVAPMAELQEIAKSYNLVVIEDMAQALGAELSGEMAGHFSTIACTSFFPSKNLGAAGDAGMMFTADKDLAERLRALRVHGGKMGEYLHQEVGFNSRLDEVQALVLSVKADYLTSWEEGRRSVAARYQQMLEPLEEKGLLVRPKELPERRHVYHQYTLRIPGGRDRVRDHLRSREIGCNVYYPLGLHQQPCFAGHQPGAGEVNLEQTERACREVLSLPIFPELKESEQNLVVEALGEILLNS